MKVQVFLSFCLVAISASAVSANCCGCCCGGGNNPPVTPTTPTVTVAPPTTNCGVFIGLENLIIQILNIVCYILNNVGKILTAIAAAPTGNTLLADLRDIISELLTQVQNLLSSPNLTNDQIVTLQGLIQGLLNRLIALVQSILGGGTTYICTNDGGLNCPGVAAIISALGGILSGIFPQDFLQLTPVLNQIIQLINSVLNQLV